jgi:hypothetical protein
LVDKQPDNAENFNYLGCSITKDVGCSHEMKSRITMAKTELNKKKVLLTSKLNFNVRKKPAKRYIWRTDLYRAETWTLRKVNQKYLRSFEMLLEDGNKFNQAQGLAKSNLYTHVYTYHRDSQADRSLSLRCN